MSVQLTWNDLLIEDFTPEQADQWLSEWSWLVKGEVAPLFLSKFGDWFLRRPNGSTQLLDVLEGGLSTIAATPEEFQAQVNSREWQEERLLSALIYGFHEKGIIPGPGQCYALAPHPALVGKINPDSVIVMDILVWESICSQVFEGSA